MTPESFLDHFEDFPDHRIDRKKLYTVQEILIVALCGTICGCEGWEDLEDYGKTKLAFLKRFAPFENGAPSDDTLRRFFRAVDPQEFKKRFVRWTESLCSVLGKVIAIDGKTARRSFDKHEDLKPLHMVSAFVSEARIVLGQQKTGEKSNEITAIPELLEWLDVRGAIVTIDAMGCQKAIAEKIVDKGGDYIFGLKGNQGNLNDDVRVFFEKTDGLSSFQDKDWGHGRAETRTCYASNDVRWLIERNPGWKGLSTIIMIESEREEKGEKSFERRFYISSHHADPEKLLRAIRLHWGVENTLHWILDMSFGEDQSRIRKGNAPENMAIIRHTALNMLQQVKQKRQSIKRLRKLAGWENSVLERILST